MKKRGSALVIAMLLMAAIGGIAVLFGRVVYLEIRNTTIATNGISAYYAAESGIEEGFLRYRYDKDQQVPIDSYDPATGYISSLSTSSLVGYNLTDKTGVLATVNNFFNGEYESKYFLNIGSTSASDLGPTVSDLGSLDAAAMTEKYPDYIVGVDNSARIDLGDYFAVDGARTLNLNFRYLDSTAAVQEKTCALLEVKLIGQKTDGSTSEYKEFYKNSGCSYDQTNIKGLGNPFPYSNEIGSGSIFYSSPINVKFDLAPTVTLANSILVIRNIDASNTDKSVVFGLDMDGNSHIAMSNTITSRGYFGGSTRTMIANIDRRHGALSDLFNYVIYRAN